MRRGPLTHAEALAAWRVDGELRDGTTLPCSGFATAAQPTAEASPSTSPAPTDTKTPSCSADAGRHLCSDGGVWLACQLRGRGRV